MARPSVDVQAKNLAEFMAGIFAGWVESNFVPQYLEGETKVERTGISSFTMTTRSGTVLRFDVTAVEAGE